MKHPYREPGRPIGHPTTRDLIDKCSTLKWKYHPPHIMRYCKSTTTFSISESGCLWFNNNIIHTANHEADMLKSIFQREFEKFINCLLEATRKRENGRVGRIAIIYNGEEYEVDDEGMLYYKGTLLNTTSSQREVLKEVFLADTRDLVAEAYNVLV